MNLNAQVTTGCSVYGIIIGHITHQHTVHIMLEAVSICNNADLIPIACLNMSLQGIIGTQLSSDFGRSPGLTFPLFPDFPFGDRDRTLLSPLSQRGGLSFLVFLSRCA